MKRSVVYRIGDAVMTKMLPLLEDVKAAKARVVEAELRFQLLTDAVLEAFKEGKEIPDGVMFDPDRWEYFILDASDEVQESAEKVKSRIEGGGDREGVEGQESISEVVSQEITGPVPICDEEETPGVCFPEEEES